MDAISYDVDQEVQVMTNVVLGLDDELLKSSHEVLNGLFALFKGK